VKTHALLLALTLLLLAGCNNECQQLCSAISDYVADCESDDSSFTAPFPHGGSAVSDCRNHFSRTNKIEGSDLTPFEQYRNTCRQLTRTSEDSTGANVVTLRAQFSCEEMQSGPGLAFGAGAGGTR
jgi:hypothetical protein